MDLYQSLREPPILTAVIGTRCSHGIVLIADSKITRINSEKFESTVKKKIGGDLAHFLISYIGPPLTFNVFRKFMVGDMVLNLAAKKIRFNSNIAESCKLCKED